MNSTEAKMLYKQYGPGLLILISLYLSLFVPFLTPILLAFIFSCATFPLIKGLKNSKWLPFNSSPGPFLAIIFMVICLSFAFGLYIMLQDLIFLLSSFKNNSGSIDSLLHFKLPALLYHWFKDWSLTSLGITKSDIILGLKKFVEATNSFMLENLKLFAAAVPAGLLKLFIFILAYLGFSTIGENSIKKMMVHFNLEIPLKTFEAICLSTLSSLFLVAFVQAILVTLVGQITSFFSLTALFLITFTGALIPLVGGGPVAFIVALYYLLAGEINNAAAFFLCFIVVATSDNLIRAWLNTKRSKNNIIFSLISLIGSIVIFGASGIIFGPIIEQSALFYLKRKKEINLEFEHESTSVLLSRVNINALSKEI